MSERVSVAILASGDMESGAGGSTMERFIRDAETGIIEVDMPLVICNNSPKAVPGFYKRIDNLNHEFSKNIEVLNISGKTHPGRPQEKGQTLDEAEAIYKETLGVGYICLLGYMKKVNGVLMEARGWKPEYALQDPEHQGIFMPTMTNNHPSKLPETAGTWGPGAHWRALELGLPFSAYTLQVAAPEIDEGPIIEEHLVLITDEMKALWATGRKTDQKKARDLLRENVMAIEKEQTAPAVGRWLKARVEFWQNAA